jgi:membrane-bound ClpP family serine protease
VELPLGEADRLGLVRGQNFASGDRTCSDVVRSASVHDSEQVNPDSDPDQLPGRIGHVTVPIPMKGPGEIVVSIRGGTERYAAWCDEPVAKNTSVVVVEVRSPRSVVVAPFPEADNL